MKRKSTLVDSVSAEPEVSAVGRKRQFPQSNGANSAVGKKLSIVNCTLLIVFCLFFGGKAWGQQSIPYSYGFENNNLATDGWVQTTSNSSSGIYNYDAHGGSYLFRFQWNENPGYLRSPQLTGTGSGVHVSFYYKNSSSSYTEQFQVGYTTENNTDPSTYSYSSTIFGTNDWLQFEGDFPTGTKYIAIKYIYTDGYYLYIDDFDFALPSSCPKPTALSVTSTTATSATLSWTPSGSETVWQYSINDGSWTNLAGVTGTTTKTATITGLTASTAYTVKIRANCGGGDFSDPTGNVSFATACTALTISALPYTQGFESETCPANCWTLVYGDGIGTTNPMIHDDSYHNSGSRSFRFSSYSSGSDYNQYLISPEIDVASALYVTFHYANYGGSDNLFFGYSTTDVSISSFTWTEALENSGSQSNWLEYEQGLPAGTRYIAFHYYGDYAYYVNLDDVTIGLLSSCLKPTALTFVSATTTTATISWTPGGSETAWQYTLDDGANWNNFASAPTGTTTKTGTITGLSAGSSYTVKVRAYCSSSDQSNASNGISFTTPLCDPANMCEITFALIDSYGDGWNGASMDVVDASTGVVLANWTVNSGSSSSGALSVCNGRTLNFVWNSGSYDSECSYTIKDANGDDIFSGSGTLSTVNYTVNCGSCPKPTGLTASNITGSSADISWSGSASAYNLGSPYISRSDIPSGYAAITLTVGDVWGDGSGYQMLLDANANAYGSIIPETGGLTSSGDASAETYAQFEYKIPTNADGSLATSNIVLNNSNTIFVPAGTYDWCITNPTDGDRMWIASGYGNVGGRANDYVFETGKHYEFIVAMGDNTNDKTDVYQILYQDNAVSPITFTSLSSNTAYRVYAQSDCGGDGTSGWSSTTFTTAFQISTVEEWNQFCDNVNGCTRDFYGETVFLAANIGPVSTMAGTESCPFRGTFEGQGYKINVDISSSEQGAAPFRYISGATIQNLKVDGTITTTAHHASGLVGFCVSGSTNTIQNCHISTNVTNSNAYNGDSGNNYMGGLIGHNMNATTNIIGCVYDGTLSSEGFKGGFVGFTDDENGNPVSITIRDSYFAGNYSPAYVTDGGNNYKNFSPVGARSGHVFTVNLNSSNFYYNTDDPQPDGADFVASSYDIMNGISITGISPKHGYSVTGESPVTVAMNGTPTTYNVSGITAYSTGIVYDGTIYGGSGDVLALSLDGSSCGYETDHGSLSGSGNPYSLTMEANNTVISAPVYTISASVNPAGTGSVSGTGSYICGATATLEATANTGYHFVNWTKNSTEVSTSATYNFTVTEAADYVANFEINTYTVTTVIHPTEGGSAEGAGTYTHGSSCTLEATANTGYQFVNWTASNGSVVSANASYTFTVTGDVTYQANFTKTTVTSLPWTENFDNGYSCASGAWVYLHGEWATPLRHEKTPNVTNYSWGAYSDQYCLEMRANNSDNMVVLPQFDQPLNKLKIKFQIGRGNTASGYTVKLGYVTDPSDASTFHELSTINTPSNSVASHTQYTCDLTTNNNAPSSSEYRLAIKYTTTNMEDSWYLDDFDVRRVYTIAVSDEPSSSASSLSGDGKYDHGANCTVTATAGDCYNFVNWTENGSVVSTDASYSFTAEADRNLVANFTQWTLNIDNNQTSLECINTGTEVVLTASATSNSTPTYEWAVSSGSTEGTASSNTYTVSPTALSNTYKVSATVGGCVVSASNTVTVKPNITNISSSEGDEVCFGLTTELAATCTDANASYSWNGGAGSGSPWTTPAITGTTNFTVVATGTNSCTVESTKSIGMKVPGNQPMTHAPEHGAIWTGYESADWSDVDNWVYFDGSYRALEGLSDTLNLILRTGDSDKCILNNPVINSPSFASNSGMIVRRPITIGEGTELNIDGDLNVESGSITFSSTGALLVTGNANIASGASVAFDNKDTLSIAGNLVLEGSLDFPESDTTPALRLGGNLVIDGGSLDEGGTLVFAGSGTQNVSNGASPLTLNNNVRLNMHRSRAGVPHTIFPDGTIFSKTTIFEYGIMDGDVTFNATGRTIVCGDYESYASGRITKIGAGNNFTFPTGDDNVLGSITAKINSGNTVHAKFHHNSADNGDGTHGFGLDVIPRWWNVADMCSDDPEPFNHVSNFEYWDISSPVELSNVILMANSATAAEHFHNPSEYTESDIQVAAFNNGCWGNFGGTAEISGSDHNVITITGAKIPKDPHRVVADFLITLGSKSHETLLPIELTSFTATCDGRSTLIEWTTATERNNDYFSLERSDDAINFTEVARVAGAGNSIEPIDYAYNDYGIHGGDNYYRLVQVDYDGTRTVSEVIVANCIEPESDGEPEVLAYPNPFSSELTVVLDNFGNRAATIEVYDMLGKLIYTNKVAAPQNSYETILNLSNLPPAAYTVRVSTNDFVINRNVVKQ